jgi:hypothetical protein
MRVVIFLLLLGAILIGVLSHFFEVNFVRKEVVSLATMFVTILLAWCAARNALILQRKLRLSEKGEQILYNFYRVRDAIHKIRYYLHDDDIDKLFEARGSVRADLTEKQLEAMVKMIRYESNESVFDSFESSQVLAEIYFPNRELKEKYKDILLLLNLIADHLKKIEGGNKSPEAYEIISYNPCKGSNPTQEKINKIISNVEKELSSILFKDKKGLFN